MRTFCTWIATSLAATVFISGQGISATAGEQASAPTLEASQTSVSTRDAEHASSARTVLNRYCVSCHNERMKANYADLALDSADVSKIGERPEVWEKVVRKLRAGLMPPAGRPRPDAPVQDRLVGWLETELDRAAVAAPNPGRTEPFHRLNRAEYRNVVRDLLALDIDAASLLPTDDASYGFDNIAGVLKINHGRFPARETGGSESGGAGLDGASSTAAHAQPQYRLLPASRGDRTDQRD